MGALILLKKLQMVFLYLFYFSFYPHILKIYPRTGSYAQGHLNILRQFGENVLLEFFLTTFADLAPQTVGATLLAHKLCNLCII